MEYSEEQISFFILGRDKATITHEPCSQTICQNALVVFGVGPCVAMYLHLGSESD